MAKNPIFGQNWEKWLFFSIFQENSPVATGLKVAKMAKNGHFPENRPKVGVPARGFYINPSRRSPGTPLDPGSRNRGSGASPSPRAGVPRGPGFGTSGTGVPGDLPGRVRGSPFGPPRPLGPPGRPRRGLFYINPSRRGPAVPRGPGGVPRGYPPGRSPRALRPRVKGFGCLVVRWSRIRLFLEFATSDP